MRILLALAFFAFASAARTQEWPAKPVRIVTGGAGNFHDQVCRRLAPQLAERWGQPVVVENRAGAGMTIGTAAVAMAPADGYTLLMTDRTALASAPTLNKGLSYVPLRDLAPITLVGVTPLILVSSSGVPAKDMRELVGYVKTLKQPPHFVDAGPATVTHMANEQFKHATGADIVSVHYNGTPPAMLALLAGEAQAGFILAPIVLPHIKAGKVRAYAITAEKRFAGAPDIPTVGEFGMPELVSLYWIALMAPARTPQPVIDKVNRDVTALLKAQDMRDTMQALGAEAAPGPPGELGTFIRSETAKWKKVIELAGMRLE